MPSDLSASAWLVPRAMATTPDRPAGAVPIHNEPHSTTVPSDLSAIAEPSPAATATTPVRPAGTLSCPVELSPNAPTVPSDFTTRKWP